MMLPFTGSPQDWPPTAADRDSAEMQLSTAAAQLNWHMAEEMESGKAAGVRLARALEQMRTVAGDNAMSALLAEADAAAAQMRGAEDNLQRGLHSGPRPGGRCTGRKPCEERVPGQHEP